MSTLLNQSEPIPDTLNELSSLLAYINSLFVQTLNWKICQISLFYRGRLSYFYQILLFEEFQSTLLNDK